MNLDLSKLPDDTAALKEIIIFQQEKYGERIDYLEQMVGLLQKQIFGSKSEKHVLPDHDQLQLFDSIESSESDRHVSEDKIVIPKHTRKKRGRKPLPPDLPRVDVIHDRNVNRKLTPCDNPILTPL
jgi:transposase